MEGRERQRRIMGERKNVSKKKGIKKEEREPNGDKREERNKDRTEEGEVQRKTETQGN